MLLKTVQTRSELLKLACQDEFYLEFLTEKELGYVMKCAILFR